MLKAVADFLSRSSAGGLMLMLAASLALIVANSPWAESYESWRALPFTIMLADWSISKPLLLWINDGLMAIFFLLVGLELKRELLEGELSKPGQLRLPLFAAAGGMIVPALVYIFFNWGDSAAMRGWAIPAATDIAFALGVLALLGKKVPIELKLFLVSLAIIDDVGAIVIIALFYTSQLSMEALIIAFGAVLILFWLNRSGIRATSIYLIVGWVLWFSVLKSGVHATLAGVLLAFFIPLKEEGGTSPLKDLEHNLHESVAFIIVPIFAFANAGVSLSGVGIDTLMSPVTLGIALGLLIGKPIGVMLFSWVAVRLNWAKLPNNLAWGDIFGVSLLCGIGFTMSLFIGGLAFESSSLPTDRLGILLGSILASLVGYIFLKVYLSKRASLENTLEK